MGLLTSYVSRLRNDPRLLRFPPYLALLCMLGGITWVLLLPLNEYSRRTYVSENALLPGQVHTYFHGSEQNIFRAYRHEIAGVLEPKEIEDENGNPTGRFLVATESHKNGRLEQILKDAGLKTARQQYRYESAGQTFQGENVYTVVHGPRADGTESIVLIAPIRNAKGELNVRGVTLLTTLARYFSRWSLWSKDIILVITPDTAAGPQAFVDAYHSMHDPKEVAALSLKSGHIQGAIVIDFPLDHNFETLHVTYDGVNGQLPNLDLINTAISIITGQMGMGCTIQNQHEYSRSEEHAEYLTRLKTLGRGMLNQALGHSTGAHSVFMPYHIDAITLTSVGHGWQDEMAFGRSIESLVRSLNNLLEKLHQSFFFYLLLQNTRFVSIGTYLPSAMAIGAAFTIVAIFQWVSGGYEELEESQTSEQGGEKDKKRSKWRVINRPLTLPLAILSALHLTSMLSIFLLRNIQVGKLVFSTSVRSAIIFAVPTFVAVAIKQYVANTSSSTVVRPSTTDEISTASSSHARTKQLYTILSSLSLLILGLELTVLATLNFSLSMFLGLLCAPLAFVGYTSSQQSTSPASTTSPATLIKSIASLTALVILSPPAVTILASILDIYYFEPFRAPIGILGRVREFLEEEAFAFNVLGAWGVNVGVWAVWVPAWCVGMTGVVGSLLGVSDAPAPGTSAARKEVKAKQKVESATNEKKVKR